MDRASTIESVIDLARAERVAAPDALPSIRAVRERLESSLDGSARPSEAARVLGVRPPSLKRWLDSGDIPTVLTRSGRREISIGELVEITLEAEELRREGHERVLSRVIRGRRKQAAELDIDALLPPRRPRTHRQAELQSLAYHRLVAQRLTPQLVTDAGQRVERWEREGTMDTRWADEWRRLLARPLPELTRVLSSDSTRARELRQSSPFVGLVSEHERRRIVEAVEARR